MYGLPGESMQTWESDLNQHIRMKPQHISAYHLIYEEGTALWKLREQHRVEEADEELSVSLFTLLIHKLKKKDTNIMKYPIFVCRECTHDIIQVTGPERSI